MGTPVRGSEASSAVRFDNLTLGYDRHPAVHHLQCTIDRGAMVAIVGPNGAGKSTLLKAVAGEIEPMQGSYAISMGREAVAYLPQQAEMDLSFPVTVFDMVAMGLWRSIGAFGRLNRQQIGEVRSTLARVSLSGLEHRPIGTLSGGQLQRARFARLILQDADLLLLDEPFNSIDGRTTEDLAALMLEWHGEGRTILAVLHDLEQVHAHFPECLLLAREQVGFGPTARILTVEHLARARRLAEGFDAHAAVCHRHPEQEQA